MKHAIYPEKQGTPTATSEDANYPATNLLTDYRKEVWKASDGVSEATLRVPISANAEVISLHNTNATTAVCTITLDASEQALNAAAAVDKGGGLVGIPCDGHGYSENDVVLINGTTNYDGVYTLPDQTAGGANEFIITAVYAAETFAGTDTVCVVVESTTHTLSTDRFWQEYTEQTGAHTGTIKLTVGTGTVEAGVVRAGELLTLANPGPGISERLKDFSIKKNLRNGAVYTKKLDMVRTFSYSMVVARETVFRNLVTLYEYYGPDPFAMLLTDNATNDNIWAVFGSFDNSPVGAHSYPSYSQVSISVTEAV